MKLQKPLFIFAVLLVGIGTLTFAATNVSAQDRFDDGDDEDDLGGDDSDSDDSSNSDNDDSDRFDDGDDEDDLEGGDDGDDSDRFDDGDDEDDRGNDPEEDEGDDRFDDGDDEDDRGNDEDQQDQEEQDEGDQDQTPSETGNTITIDPLDLRNRNISIQATPSQVNPGEQVTITGRINTNKYINGMPITILLNGGQVETLEVDGKEFSTTLTSEEQGINTVTAEILDASMSTEFQVGQGTGLQILSTTTSGDITPGNTIEVCSRIESPQDAQISFYTNGNLQESTTGSGEVCFDATVEEGSNTFEVEATLREDTVTDTITRDTRVPDVPEIPGGQDNGGLLNGMTGSFSDAIGGFDSGLSSPGLRWLFSILVGLSMAATILL